MPKISVAVNKKIKALSRKSLEEVVIKMAAKDQMVFDFLMVNYLDKESGEQELFEKTKSDLNEIFNKNYIGNAEQLQNVKRLSAGIKRLNKFTKVSKNKILEAKLLIYILEDHVYDSNDLFGTCFDSYDSKVAQIFKRLLYLVTKKLHPDYLGDFQDIINKFLDVLHSKANHTNSVYNLPESV
ncbi:MAG: hypothetical protein U9R19_04120 [Bacteroidota bacterium]|nr:hypothetical protein [Bacteroidota bacterium]